MARSLTGRARSAVAGLAFVGLTSGVGHAQFMAPGAYPVLVVPPPPAQSMVMPKRPKPPPPPPSAPPPPPEQHQLVCSYQGQTRVCQ